MRAENFKPPRIAQGLTLIFGVLGFFYGKILHHPNNLWGILPFVFGFWIMMDAHTRFKKSETDVCPLSETSKFITNGSYKLTRNPMYLGFFLIMIGIAILIGSYVSIIAPILFAIIMNYTWIPFEEKKMEKQFGNEYLKYKQNVRRWI